MPLIYKIVPRAEWEKTGKVYAGSPHDQGDGFLHFSTGDQLSDTLRLYYAGQDNLLLIAVDATLLGDDLRYEHSPSRNQDFPHLFGPLPSNAVRWSRPIAKNAGGDFVLPDLT